MGLRAERMPAQNVKTTLRILRVDKRDEPPLIGHIKRIQPQHFAGGGHVFAGQHGPRPGEVRPGLSAEVSAALPVAAEWVARAYFTAD